MTSTLASTERERRRSAAPVGLLLLFWGLGVGPVAHAVIAHGEPLPRESADSGWVQHTSGRGGLPEGRGAIPSHHHAPGDLEHLQLAISAAAVVLTVAAVVFAVRVKACSPPRATALRRWRLPEVPGAP